MFVIPSEFHSFKRLTELHWKKVFVWYSLDKMIISLRVIKPIIYINIKNYNIYRRFKYDIWSFYFDIQPRGYCNDIKYQNKNEITTLHLCLEEPRSKCKKISDRLNWMIMYIAGEMNIYSTHIFVHINDVNCRELISSPIYCLLAFSGHLSTSPFGNVLLYVGINSITTRFLFNQNIIVNVFRNFSPSKIFCAQ